MRSPRVRNPPFVRGRLHRPYSGWWTPRSRRLTLLAGLLLLLLAATSWTVLRLTRLAKRRFAAKEHADAWNAQPRTGNVYRDVLAQHLARHRATSSRSSPPSPAEADPIDYVDPEYARATASLSATHRRLLFEDRSAGLYDSVLQSIQLHARPGHRTRVTHTIGGDAVDARTHRTALASSAVFEGASPRDYDVDPVRLRFAPVVFSSEDEASLPVPCASCREDLASCDARHECVLMVSLAEEELERRCLEGAPRLSDSDIVLKSYLTLTSDVPVPFLSAHDFGLLRRPREKFGWLASFLERCDARTAATLRELTRRLGEDRARHYGACERNAAYDEELPESARDVETASGYRFTFVGEEGSRRDHVSMGVFRAWVAGSLPVVTHGAPNLKMFAPDARTYPYESDALLDANDLDNDPAALASFLAELGRDSDAYESALRWKTRGFSEDFVALVQLTAVTSEARRCVAMADALRRRDGPSLWERRALRGPFLAAEEEGDGAAPFTAYFRERGSLVFTAVTFSRGRPTYVGLVRAAAQFLVPTSKPWFPDNELESLGSRPVRVYAVYTPSARRVVLGDEDAAVLPDRVELEVIFV